MHEPNPTPLTPIPLPHRDWGWILWQGFLVIASPIWVPYAAWRLFLGRSREGRNERFGGGKQLPPAPRAPGARIWFHGVSVGEVEALAPVIQAWSAAGTGREVVVSTTTRTGRARIDALYPDAVERRFTPLDLPWSTARALKRIAPSALVLGESELWPSLLRQAARRIPVLLVNARISDQTLPRARRLRPLYRWMLRRLTAIGVQTEEDRSRFEELGAPASRIFVTGNTKFDRTLTPLDAEARTALRHELGVGDAPLIVAGSTFPGEDELVLDALESLRLQAGAGPLQALRLVLAPRHPERAKAVADLVAARGLRLWRRSAGAFRADDASASGVDVVLVDTVGELARIYGVADVAVVGRSFRMGGGQNPLEPMAHGVPVIFGPRMENFRAIAALAENGGAAIRCNADAFLVSALRQVLNNPEQRALMSAAGPQILKSHQGAAARSAALIDEVLQSRTSSSNARPNTGPHAGPNARPHLGGRLLLGTLLLGFLSACAASPPSTLGGLPNENPGDPLGSPSATGQDGLAPCSTPTNCVRTEPVGLPAPWDTAPLDALADELTRAIETLPRTQTLRRDISPDLGIYVRVEVRSRIFRFVDDLEFLVLEPQPGAGASAVRTLTLRSASRVGRNDLGVNQARIEAIERALGLTGAERESTPPRGS